MQTLALQHTMMHRGAGATRAHTRWHPYTPPRSTSTAVSTPNYAFSSRSSSTSSTDSFLQTPADSVYFVSPSPSCSQNNISPPRFVHGPHPQCGPTPSFSTPQTCYVPTPQVPKTSYIAALVDQAVRSLTDIWHPEDIPAVFATSTRISAAPKPQQQELPPVCRPEHMRRLSVQLPSPSSPSTMPSPLDPSFPDVSCQRPRIASMAPTTTTVISPSGTKLITTEKNLVPIKTFVHEVLRRSRTTCSVLQSALCYIEAVRSRVPELVELERNGSGSSEESELGERIENGLVDGFHQSGEVMNFSNGTIETSAQSCSSTSDQFAIPPTVVLPPNDRSFASQSQPTNFDNACKRRKLAQEQKDLPPLPPLPSPLLCPRRTFLAALILASKFLQDRCYSNRAWAKLSGLPAREVGRCERALGEALEWRLWVGKNPVALGEDGTGMGGMPGLTPSSSSRAVRKTLSDSALFGINICGPRPTHRPFQIPSPPLSDPGCSPVVYLPHTANPMNPMVPRFS